MSRDYKVYLDDISQAILKIRRYTRRRTYPRFLRDTLLQDAVARNLEIIGEAVKQVPEDVRKHHPEVEWKRIAGLRDILAHEYFGVDPTILWDVVRNKLPELSRQIAKLRKSSP